MSLEKQDGYHEVHVYERNQKDPRYTIMVAKHIVHGDRTQIARYFHDVLPDHQTPYVHVKLAGSANSPGFRDRVAQVIGADGGGEKPTMNTIIFLGKNGLIPRNKTA